MAKDQGEIMDPGFYCQQNLTKIDAVHGFLAQQLTQGFIKADKADYLKQKFEDLRGALRTKLMYERRLVAESAEMITQIKIDTEKIEKLGKKGERNAEMIAIVTEDWDQAGVEAAIAIEKVGRLALLTGEMEKIREENNNKIEEIKREHAAALEPVIAHLQQEIKIESEECLERAEKIKQCTKEIEENKARQVECLESIRSTNEAIVAREAKLEELGGAPARLKKQVGDLSKQLHSFQVTKKQKKEELVKVALDMHKIQLHVERQVSVAHDLSKYLEMAKTEVEGILDEQVYLEIQIIDKESAFKHEQDVLNKAVKERERVFTRLQEIQLDVEKIQSNIPMFKQENQKIHREFKLVETERNQKQGRAEELRKEIDICINTLLAAEEIGNKVALRLRESNSKVQDLEREVVECTIEQRNVEHHKGELVSMWERLSQAASSKYTLWKQTTEKITVEDTFITSFQKRLVELQKRHRDDLVLYNVIRSQRNKFIHLTEACKVTIAEMEDKLIPLDQIVAKLREELQYKQDVLNKVHQQVLANLQACEAVKDSISKCTQALRKIQSIVEELKVAVKKQEEFIHRQDKYLTNTSKNYSLAVKTRNSTGLSLIDRNDELCILYEKSNVQVELLKFSELELSKRVDEISLLFVACALTHDSLFTIARVAPNPNIVYDEFVTLQMQLREEKIQLEQLSILCESPNENIDRWRLVKGRDLSKRNLKRKIWAIHELLGARKDELTEKNIILKEVSELTENTIKESALKLEGGTKLSKKWNENVRNEREINRILIAVRSELSFTQAMAISLRKEKDNAGKELDEARQRLEVGHPPTKDTTKILENKERESIFLRRLETAHKASEKEKRAYREARCCSTRPKTTPTMTRAEEQPNAYYAEPLGLPVPFGVHYPFRPSTSRGSIMRHSYRKRDSSAVGMSTPKPIKSS